MLRVNDIADGNDARARGGAALLKAPDDDLAVLPRCQNNPHPDEVGRGGARRVDCVAPLRL